jgi:hypothetical protein
MVSLVYRNAPVPKDRGKIFPLQVSESDSVAHLVKTESTVRMGVLHEVTGHTSRSFLRGDFPVTVGFNLRLDVADRSAKVTDSESGLRLVGSEALAAGKVVDDPTLLGESVTHNIESPKLSADLE